MNRLFILLLLSSTLWFLGCSDDDNSTTPTCSSCPSPFECIDGICTDPCDLGRVDCGDLDCAAGKCICPTGFTGDDCDVEQVPTRILVEEIWVYDFPLLNPDDEEWDRDANDGTGPEPDIYPWVAEAGDPRTYRGLTVYDAAEGDTLYYDLRNVGATVYEISDPNANTGFQLWDRDLNAEDDDYFFNASGRYVFSPYEAGRPGFPVRDTLDIGEDARVVISYRFD